MRHFSFFLLAVLFAHVLVIAYAGRRNPSMLGSPTPKTRKQRKSGRRAARQLTDSEMKDYPSAQVFERRLRATDDSTTSTTTPSTRGYTTTTTSATNAPPSGFMSSIHTLSDISIWKLEFEDGWDTSEDDDSSFSTVWSPGYMMMSKLNELQFDREYINYVDAQCILPESSTTITTTTTSTTDVAPSTISINTTLCPSFDVMLQVVNSISTRLVFTPDGGVIPFEIFATDFVGTLNNMDMESQVMDAITYLWSIELGTSLPEESASYESYDVLILNEMIQFKRVPDCSTVGCFGSQVFANTASFWSLDAFRSTSSESSEWNLNMLSGIGVWMQMINNEDQDGNPATTAFLVQAENFASGPVYGTTWEVDLASGSVSKATSTVDEEGENEVKSSLTQLKSIVASATSVTFDLSEVPWSVQITSTSNEEAVLYASYIGAQF